MPRAGWTASSRGRAKAKDDVRWPWFDLRLYGAVAALDHLTGRAWIVAADHELFATSPQARSDAAAARLTRANSAGRTSDEEVADRAAEEAEEAALAAAAAAEAGAEIAAAVGSTAPPVANMTDKEYAAAFAKLHKYLRAGDLYQANLTRRFEAPCTLDPPALYARLRRTAPAPYAVLLDDPERAIVSASPELFLARHGARLVTRPIKGTRPRDRRSRARRRAGRGAAGQREGPRRARHDRRRAPQRPGPRVRRSAASSSRRWPRTRRSRPCTT